MSDEVSIPVLTPILEGPELGFLRRPGELCGGDVVNQKSLLNITGTCPYVLHSDEASITVEGPMMLLRYGINQVEVTAFLNPCISTMGL